MYLKKLEMKGFKSFADKMVIDFDSGVTCVVGPNGSGKSNITDGIRWVLGEQKAKVLRGYKMEDIIFNGTNNRKKMGMAEVTLIFDNSNNYFPLEYNELRISRRVYRSGESEYLINNSVCRLKDVKELLMDTGIGIDGYTIIGQGRIDEILSNNPDERRKIFEEASGIVKYKTRKKESEKKLELTEENLIRVKDIYLELESRVQPLKIESEKARKYLDLISRLEDLELNVFINEIDSINKKIAREEKEFSEQESILNENNALKDKLEEEKESIYIEKNDLDHRINEINASLYEAKSKILEYKGHLDLVNSKIENTEKDSTRIKDNLEEYLLKKENYIQKKSDISSYLSQIEGEIKDLKREIEGKEEVYNTSLKEMEESERFITENREVLIEKLNTIERLKTNISSLNSMISAHNERKDFIHTELSESKTAYEKELSNLDILNDEYKELVSSEEQYKKDIKTYVDELKELNNTVLELKKSYDVNHNTISAKKAELDLLKKMEEDYSGYDHSVKKAFKLIKNKSSLDKGVDGVLASLIEIPKIYETAIEVSLKKSLQHIVVDTVKTANDIIKEMKKASAGRVTFLPLDNIKGRKEDRSLDKLKAVDGYIDKASNVLTYHKKYNELLDYLLGRTIIVKDNKAALEALKIKDLKYKLVTLDGDIYIPGGTITGGSFKSKSTGIISRKRKITELEELLDNLQIKEKEFNDSIIKSKKDVLALEETIKTSKLKYDNIRFDISKKESDIFLLKENIKRYKENLDKRESELSIINKDFINISDDIKRYTEDIESITKRNEEIQLGIEEKEKILLQLKESTESMNISLTDLKIKYASLNEVFKSENDKLVNASSLEKELEDNINKSKKLLEQSEEYYLEYQQEKEAIIKQSEELTVSLDEKSSAVDALNKEKIVKDKVVKELDERLLESHSTIEAVKEKLHAIDLKKAKYDIQREDISIRLYESYEISLEEALLKKKDINMASANKDIKSIKKELKELDDVNVHAIKEYEEVSERYNFLKTQHDDLVKAKKNLEKLIRNIEKEMRERFVESFNTIRMHFSEIFNQLFIGGYGDLKLADPDNILESDIHIDVQPPGKKLQSISLLSGGEKAMTAIALLFSILKTKPAPFCILDEIEAALDDANVYRFAEFLKDFASNSQFVVITHRKGTMEIADNLFGVTMEEFGISKLVSVKLEDKI